MSARRLRVGFVLNPVAGMGGAVALKGTDGVVDRARTLGAEPTSPARADAFFARLDPRRAVVVSAPAPMGGEQVGRWRGTVEPLDVPLPASPFATTADHTRLVADALLARDLDLLVFAGGDGTACDLARTVGDRVPVLGVPAGVKMVSAVFAHSPAVAAFLVNRIAERGAFDAEPADVVDVDEEAVRRGHLALRACGAVRVPVEEGVQPGKGPSAPDDRDLAALAAAVLGGFPEGTLLLLGGGTTTRALKDAMERGGTLLGVDAYRRDRHHWRLVLADAHEAALLDLLGRHPGPVRLVLSPLGRSGFVLGRGTGPLTAQVVRAVGVENVVVVATPAKARALDGLVFDAGDDALDGAFGDYVRVVVGPDRERLTAVRRVTP